MMEGSVNIIQTRLRIVSAALDETLIATRALEGMKDCQKGTETLVPIGAGSFLRVALADIDKVITGVGAGVCIEKSVDSSILSLKDRQADLEKLSGSLQQQLRQLSTSIESSKDNLARLVQQQNESPARP
jgi:prefoldin alpha subunit